MRLRTRLILWYSAAWLASILVLVAHAVYEISISEVPDPALVDAEEHQGREVANFELLIGLPLLLTGLAGGWWLTRGTRRKLEALTEAATSLDAGNFSANLPPVQKSNDELDQLILAFRGMSTRLRDSFTRIQDFTLNASHELKTPLAVMRGEVETALAAGESEAHTEWMRSLLEEIDRLARIVDGLSFIAKMDAGMVTMKREPLDLNELVHDATEDAQLLAAVHGIEVVCEEASPAPITGDRHRLRQLMLNLADNAVKYNHPRGSIRFSLTTQGTDAVLRISNTGPGISKEQEDRIFDRFFRGDVSHSQAIEGSGLGLNIARWIVEGHRGTIRLRTREDGWTECEVRLPLRRDA